MVCPICEEPLVLDLHHIKLFSLGGKSTEQNLIPLCPRCHREAHTHNVSPTILRRIKSLWANFGYPGKKLMQWVVYCQRIRDDAQDSPVLSQYYVELQGETVDGPLPHLLKDHVFSWIRADSPPLLALLGDYGTGKTTFLRSLQVDLASKWLSDQQSALPVLVQLREYSRHRSIIDVLSDHLQGFGLRYDDLFSFPDRQPFVFLLDGLDEMSEPTRRELRSYRFFQLSKMSRTLCRIILTSRTNFFRDLQDERKHLALLHSQETGMTLRDQEPDTVYLLQFEPDQISLYLKNRFPSPQDPSPTRLRRLYDFGDLARRPILLDLLATASEDREISTILSDPSEVYDLIVNRWIHRDFWRGVDENDLRSLMAHLALQIFVSRTAGMKIAEIEGKVGRILKSKVLDKIDLDRLTENVCVSGFVSRDSKGTWEFNHQSFYEYFLANYLAEFISHALQKHSKRHSLSRTQYNNRISPECYEFLVRQLASSRYSTRPDAHRPREDGRIRIFIVSDDPSVEKTLQLHVEDAAERCKQTLLLHKFQDGLVALLESHAHRPHGVLVYGSHHQTINGKHFAMLYRSLLGGEAPILYMAATGYDQEWQKRYAVEFHQAPCKMGACENFFRKVFPNSHT